MVDRKARDRMAGALRSYMAEETTAFQFDEALSETRAATNDRTVAEVASLLWYHYDDFTDHKIRACREEWDYFNRLLLLLASDGEFETVRSWRRWGARQAVAATTLVGFLVAAVGHGFDKGLLILALPFGVVSMALAWFSARQEKREAKSAAVALALTPFPSLTSLRAVRRSVTGFTKSRYPPTIAGRRIRAPFTGFVMLMPARLLWLVLSPVVLLVQALPERDCELRVVLPEAAAASPGGA